MNPDDPTSLTPHERELAQRLADIAPRSEPSADLDLRILSAAREAGRSSSSPPVVPPELFSKSVLRSRRARRRWPLAFGIAASLMLTLGLAWRLRPLPEARQVWSSEAPLATPARTASTQDPIDSPIGSPVESKTESTPPTVQPPNAITSRARATSIQTDDPGESPASPAVAEPPIARDAASQQDAVPAAAKAAAPSVVQVPETQASGTMAEGTAAPPSPPPQNAASQADMAADSGRNPARQSDPNVSQTAAPATRGDEPSDDVPPATADAPAVRDAWLQRIRSLIEDGRIADARLSLHAFVRRYPTYLLPDDLRALAHGSTSSP